MNNSDENADEVCSNERSINEHKDKINEHTSWTHTNEEYISVTQSQRWWILIKWVTMLQLK